MLAIGARTDPGSLARHPQAGTMGAQGAVPKMLICAKGARGAVVAKQLAVGTQQGAMGVDGRYYAYHASLRPYSMHFPNTQRIHDR